MSYSPKKPSLFWPLLLITIGIVLLLSNFGILPPGSINLLWRFWPLLLVIAGLDILLGRRSALGAIITTVVTIALIVGAVLFALFAFGSPEMMQKFNDTVLKHETVDLPLNHITSADVTIDLPPAPVEIYPLSDSNALIRGDINYFGTLIFDTDTIGEHATVNLDTQMMRFIFFSDASTVENAGWRVGLHPRVALDLTLDGGSGALDADLRGLDIRTLNLDAGSGAVRILLPDRGQMRAVIDGGSGQIDIKIPESLAAKIVLDGGSGVFHADSRFRQSQETTRGESVWVTDNFAAADNFVELEIDQGSGSVVIE